MARNFRDLFKWLVPSWLSADEGGLVLYSLATLKDIYLERVYQGLVARFPSYSAGDALAEIGRERGLQRGYQETSESYVARLQAWRTPKTHRVRGTAFAAIAQVAIVAGAGTSVRVIDAKGTEHTRAADGTESYAYGVPWAWDPPGSPLARFWVELNDMTGAEANAYSGAGGDLWTRTDGNETLGIDGVSPRRISDLRDLFAQAPQWKPAGTRAMWLIVNIEGTPYEPGEPDETWSYWSKWTDIGITLATPARDPLFRYVQLTPAPYAERNQYVDAATLVDGSVYEGDPHNAAAFDAQTLPESGELYAGVSVWADAPRLPDDGDFPGFTG